MNVRDAADYLGIASKTLYKWKQSAKQNNGYLIIRGRAVLFRYRQTGAAGQGRITFEKKWLDELKQAMECDVPQESRVLSRPALSHIHVELGLPQT